MKIEASLLIGPDDWKLYEELENSSNNEELFFRYAESPSLKAIKSWGDDYVLASHGQKLMLLDLKDARIRYFVQYDFNSFRQVKLITQVAVWADKAFTLPLIDGVRPVAWVFFKYLLPMTGTLAADTLHTPDGMMFWKRRMVEALNNNLRVLVISKDENYIVELQDDADINKVASKVWGKPDKRFLNRRAIITKLPVFHDAVPLSEYLKS
jgi:hypothetical protein